MNFRTEIFPEKPQRLIAHSDSLLFIGSCFADNIGRAFCEAGFNANVNPFGVVFNPSSVARSLYHAIKNKPFSAEDLVFSQGLWHSWFHHGSFAHNNATLLLDEVNHALNETHQFLKQANVLFVTLGTAWVFQHKELGFVVTNCHKVSAANFNRYALRVDEIVQQWKPLLTDLRAFNPSLKVVFTVSPVRHLADGAHGNQLSKATLLLAVNELCETMDCAYFPAYELLLDDLRDYRFFDSDMTHPSAFAVDYIKEKLFASWLSSQTQQLANEVIKLRKAESHRPLHGSTPEWEAFKQATHDKIERLLQAHPYIKW